MFKFGPIYNVILILHVCVISAEISDKRLCANKECTDPISLAETLLVYGSDDPRILSFRAREVVTIYSKSAGKKLNLWGAEINGKRGYIPLNFVKEYKILTPKPSFEVDTEDSFVKSNSVDSESTVSDEKPSPDPVKAPYEIIDGTTIYLNNDIPYTENIVSDNSNHKETEPLTSKIVNNEQTKSKDIAPQTENLKNENKLEESLVGNVFSSLANLIIEGSGLSSPKEDEHVHNDNLDDIEIEVETDDEFTENEDVKEEEAKILVAPGKPESGTPLSAVQLSNQETTSEDLTKFQNDPNLLNMYDGAAAISVPDKKLDQHLVNSESLKPTVSNNVDVPSNSMILDKSTLQMESEYEGLSQEPPNSITKEAVTTLPQQKVLYEKLVSNVESVTPALKEIENKKVEQELKINEVTVVGDTQGVQLQEQQTLNTLKLKEGDTINDKVEDSSENLLKADKSKEQLQADMIVETQNPEEKLTEGLENKFNKKIEPSTNFKKANSEEVDVNETLSLTDEPSNSKIKDILATSDAENPISSASFEHQIHSPPGIFSNIFSSSESAEFPNINKDVIDKNEKSIVSENLNPASDTDQKNEISDGDSIQNENTLLVNDGKRGIYNKNVIEETIRNERNLLRSDGSLDESNIKETEANEMVTESIPQQLLIEQEVQDANGKSLPELHGLLSKPYIEGQSSCLAGFHESDCPMEEDNFHLPAVESSNENTVNFYYFKLPIFAYEAFLVLIISAVTVVVFLWGYIYIDRRRKEVQLVAKINDVQKQFLILRKENELLTEKVSEMEKENMNKAELASNEVCEVLRFQLAEADSARLSLEHQIQNLEKELENSTEVGLELNRMLSEFLNSDNGSDTLIANIDQLQRQLVEQQGTINTYNETLSIRETENHELRLELEINNSRVNELQSELNKMALNLLKLEEDKEQLQNNYETDMASLKVQLEGSAAKFKSDMAKIAEELNLMKQKYDISHRNLELKTNEYKLLKENINQVNSDNNNSDILKSMFDTTSIKAELLQLRNENSLLNEGLQRESSRTSAFEKQAYLAMEDAQLLKTKYDNADQERMEAQTKLEILSNYFKEREAQLQKELSKQESMWVEKQGEASSTIERIKYMQEELQNYKAQYESLKQEIVAQEVEMKSQISVLEKKAHENWVAARQSERKLDDAKQEAAQLRNRLTLRERNFNDDKVQNRLVSPLEQNGDLSLNDTGTSLPLMFGTREHLTTSPPLPSLPHFLPPPPGAPFMPPPLGGVPLPPPGFLPPPPSMIPGDHRPPPLGRMSSPPLNSRYSPDSMAYSPYSRNSPSPTSDDEYDRPVYRSYSPYNREDRREFSRPPPPVNRNTVRNHRGTHSSGSAHSNESLEKINRHNSKV